MRARQAPPFVLSVSYAPRPVSALVVISSRLLSAASPWPPATLAISPPPACLALIPWVRRGDNGVGIGPSPVKGWGLFVIARLRLRAAASPASMAG